MTKITLLEVGVRLNNTDRRIDRMQLEIDNLKNRLPMWATVLFTILGSLVTGLITHMAG